MPRLAKPRPRTEPVQAFFHLKPYIWDAIAEYAYKHNRNICPVMQDFLEVGLLEFLKYDCELFERFKQQERFYLNPAPSESYDPARADCLHSPPPFSAPGLPACPVTGAEKEPPTSTMENNYDLDPAH